MIHFKEFDLKILKINALFDSIEYCLNLLSNTES